MWGRSRPFQTGGHLRLIIGPSLGAIVISCSEDSETRAHPQSQATPIAGLRPAGHARGWAFFHTAIIRAASTAV